MDIDGVRRDWVAWPEWAVSTRLDTADYWCEVQSAVRSHQSQVGMVPGLWDLSPIVLRELWGTQQFYRVMSTVPVADTIEDDLFTGLRDQSIADSPGTRKSHGRSASESS